MAYIDSEQFKADQKADLASIVEMRFNDGKCVLLNNGEQVSVEDSTEVEMKGRMDRLLKMLTASASNAVGILPTVVSLDEHSVKYLLLDFRKTGLLNHLQVEVIEVPKEIDKGMSYLDEQVDGLKTIREIHPEWNDRLVSVAVSRFEEDPIQFITALLLKN